MVALVDPVTAVILARGGSKGVPRKNVIDFNGRPLIAWTITQVLESGISDVHVSTDDAEIAFVARRWGARVIQRPLSLSGDTASGDAAVLHAINELELLDSALVVMPQVSSPLRWPSHISEVAELVAEGSFDSAFTAVRIDDICVWLLGETPRSVTYDYAARSVRQAKPPMVVENGSVYCARAGALRQSGNRLSGRIGVSLMPRWTMPEIDDLEDVRLCEVLMASFVTSSE